MASHTFNKTCTSTAMKQLLAKKFQIGALGWKLEKTIAMLKSVHIDRVTVVLLCM